MFVLTKLVVHVPTGKFYMKFFCSPVVYEFEKDFFFEKHK